MAYVNDSFSIFICISTALFSRILLIMTYDIPAMQHLFPFIYLFINVFLF